MDKKLQQAFAKKWHFSEEMVFTIYAMIRDAGGKYGKTARALKGFKVKLSSRQLKYFYRKVRLTDRYGTAKKIGRKQYSRLVTTKS
jgi:hypothetical protein